MLYIYFLSLELLQLSKICTCISVLDIYTKVRVIEKREKYWARNCWDNILESFLTNYTHKEEIFFLMPSFYSVSISITAAIITILYLYILLSL